MGSRLGVVRMVSGYQDYAMNEEQHRSRATVPPYLRFATVAALAWICYLGLGIALLATGLFDHYDGLFHSDPPRVIRDLTLPEAAGIRSILHPLFVLIFNPVGTLLSTAIGSHTAAAVALTTLAGATTVFLIQVFLFDIGMSARRATIWSILIAASASQIVMSAVPETFAFGGTATALSMVMAVRAYPARAQFLAALASFAQTSTNLIPAVLLYMSSLRTRATTVVARGALLAFAVVSVAAGAALIQRALYPNAGLFFVPAYRSAITPYMEELGNLRAVAGRAVRLSMHMVAYSFFAPVPEVSQTALPVTMHNPEVRFSCPRVCRDTRLADPRDRPVDSHPPELSFMNIGMFSFLSVAWPGLLAWSSVISAALFGVLRVRQIDHVRLLAGLALAAGFHFVLHTFYGDDFFLYSPHWVPLLLGAAALATRSWWDTLWLRTMVGVAATFMLLNNAVLAHSLWMVFSAQKL